MGALLVPVVTLAATAVVMLVLPAYLLNMWPPCQGPSCFDYAREMALSLSPTVHPCDDFYGYVCGGFARQYPEHANFLSLLDTRLALVRDRLLNGVAQGSADTFAERAVDAFRHCVDEYRSGRADGLQQLRQFTYTMGIHWRDTPVTFTTAGLLSILFSLSLRYGLPLLLNVRLRAWSVADDPSTRVAGLQLDLEPTDPPLVERTATSIEDALRAVAHNGTMLRFKSIAADVRRALDALQERLHEAPLWPGGMLFVQVRTIESLLPFVKAANFVALANHYLPAIFEYSMSSEVASATPSLVHELGVFLHEEAPTGRALNLVRYLLFERLLPLSTSRLEETLDVNALDALNLRIRACRDAVRRVEPRVWQFLTLQEVLTRRRLSQSARIVSAVLNATLAEYAQWQDSVTLERTRARLQMLRAEASSTPLLSAADANRRYDYVLPVSYDTVFLRWFLTSLSSGVAHANASRVDALQDTDDLRQLDALRDSKVHIDPLDAVVRVSPGFLFAPFMVDDDVPPDGVNAGALGAAVGSLVAAFLDPMHGPLDGVSRSRVKYEPATASRYRKMLDCLRSRRSRQGPVIADDAEASQVLVKQLGVRIAYGAFEKMRNDSKAKSGNSTLMAELSELLGSAQRAFFAAHCFQFCQHEVPRNVAHATSGSFRCNAVLRDVEAFRKAFKCPAGSVMRPAHLCAI
ncbi:neprilysin-1-like isoform X3 [Dermacentor albipictus]